MKNKIITVFEPWNFVNSNTNDNKLYIKSELTKYDDNLMVASLMQPIIYRGIVIKKVLLENRYKLNEDYIYNIYNFFDFERNHEFLFIGSFKEQQD